MIPGKSPPLKTPSLFAYGLPGLPLAALLLPMYVYLPTFYAADLALGFTAVAAVLMVARLWDVATDPLVGTLSDRMAWRLGRRRPWMLAGVPLVLTSAYFLFLPGADASWASMLLWTVLLTLGGTMLILPYTAWGAELSDDYNERSRIAAFREVFVVLGTLLAAGLPSLLGEDRGQALAALFWFLLVFLPVSVLVATIMVPEPSVQVRRPLPWRQSLTILRRNGPFRRLITAYFLNGIANGLPATLFLLFVEHVLQSKAYSGLLLFIYFLCGIAAVPGWLWLSRRYGKHKVWVGAMLLACSVFIWVPFLGPGDLGWFVVVCVLTGLPLGADLVLPPSMQADVIDLDRLRSQRERAGLYFAIWGMATKLALALAVGIAFPLLQLAGFDPETAVPGGFSLLVLAGLYALVPVVFKVTSIMLVWRYPITAKRHNRLRQRIAAREASTRGAATYEI